MNQKTVHIYGGKFYCPSHVEESKKQSGRNSTNSISQIPVIREFPENEEPSPRSPSPKRVISPSPNRSISPLIISQSDLEKVHLTKNNVTRNTNLASSSPSTLSVPNINANRPLPKPTNLFSGNENVRKSMNSSLLNNNGRKSPSIYDTGNENRKSTPIINTNANNPPRIMPEGAKSPPPYRPQRLNYNFVHPPSNNTSSSPIPIKNAETSNIVNLQDIESSSSPPPPPSIEEEEEKFIHPPEPPVYNEKVIQNGSEGTKRERSGTNLVYNNIKTLNDSENCTPDVYNNFKEFIADDQMDQQKDLDVSETETGEVNDLYNNFRQFITSETYTVPVNCVQSVPREFTPNSQDFYLIAWVGNLGRTEVESFLEKELDGTFVIRWSQNAQSYVLSYKDSATSQVAHIASIQPTEQGGISILRQGEGLKPFRNLLEYVNQMKKEKLICNPLPIRYA